MSTPEEKDTYRAVYRATYPFLTNSMRRTFVAIKVRKGLDAAIAWLNTQPLPWSNSFHAS